jgi:stage II sporulation protein AA (anti-sigma F factor antagonist)
VHPLTILVHPGPTEHTLEVCGEIDISTRTPLRAAVLDALRLANAGVRLDMARVTFLDGSGVDELLCCSRRARLHRLQLRVVNPSRPVIRVLQITGTERLLLDGSTRTAERKLRLGTFRAPLPRR